MNPIQFLTALREVLKGQGITEFTSCTCCRGLNLTFDGRKYQYLKLDNGMLSMSDEAGQEYSIPWDAA